MQYTLKVTDQRFPLIKAIDFPVYAQMRDCELSIIMESTGGVFSNRKSVKKQISQCAPESPAFDAFVRFWALHFAHEAPQNPSWTQIVNELEAGRMIQDEHFPFLFTDWSQPDFLEDGTEVLPVYEMNLAGDLVRYNPGVFYTQQCLAFSGDRRVKFFPRIVDHDGNDIVSGVEVSFMESKHDRPVFNPISCPIEGDAILEAINHAPGDCLLMNYDLINDIEVQEAIPFDD